MLLSQQLICQTRDLKAIVPLLTPSSLTHFTHHVDFLLNGYFRLPSAVLDHFWKALCSHCSMFYMSPSSLPRAQGSFLTYPLFFTEHLMAGLMPQSSRWEQGGNSTLQPHFHHLEGLAYSSQNPNTLCYPGPGFSETSQYPE